MSATLLWIMLLGFLGLLLWVMYERAQRINAEGNAAAESMRAERAEAQKAGLEERERAARMLAEERRDVIDTLIARIKSGAGAGPPEGEGPHK